MSIKKILIVITTAICLSGNAQDKEFFLLAGQSNAQGVGGKGSKVFCTENTCYEYNVLKDSIVPLVDPVGQAWKTLHKSGGSLCPAFAKEYNRLSGRSVYMVTAARSGSSCHKNGELSPYDTWDVSGNVFGDAVEKTQKDVERCGVPLSGVIWIQGERDANAILDGKLSPEEFGQALESLIIRFREVFGSTLPFYIVLTGLQTDREPRGSYFVRETQVKVAKKMKNVYVAYTKTDTFPAEGLLVDKVHYCQTALNDIGVNVARFAYKKRD